MKFISIISILVVIAGTGYAKKENPSVKSTMREVHSNFVSLIPFIASEMKFTDPRHEGKIVGHLNKMQEAFKKSNHNEIFNMPGFRPSYDVIKSQLESSSDAFQASHKTFARTRLKALSGVCFSCHEQLPRWKKLGKQNLLKAKRKEFLNDFDYAEYLQLIRQFDQAVSYYKKSIDAGLKIKKQLGTEKPNKKIDTAIDQSIRKAIKNVLTIYIKSQQRPHKALTFLHGFENEGRFSDVSKNRVLSWKAGVLKAMDRDKFDKLLNDKDYEVYQKMVLRKLLERSSLLNDEGIEPELLKAAGVLARFLSSHHQSKFIPQVLFNLAVIERHLSNNIFYSFADIYLKECINRYPSSAIARQCYKEYEEQLQLGFSGSSGTYIPEDEKAELKALKKKLEK